MAPFFLVGAQIGGHAVRFSSILQHPNGFKALSVGQYGFSIEIANGAGHEVVSLSLVSSFGSHWFRHLQLHCGFLAAGRRCFLLSTVFFFFEERRSTYELLCFAFFPIIYLRVVVHSYRRGSALKEGDLRMGYNGQSISPRSPGGCGFQVARRRCNSKDPWNVSRSIDPQSAYGASPRAARRIRASSVRDAEKVESILKSNFHYAFPAQKLFADSLKHLKTTK